MEPTKELILQAARSLAGVCDGASARDSVGYNGVDSSLMKDLACRENHTDRQLRLMWHVLRKYRKQLSSYGIEYDAMVPPLMLPLDQGGQFVPQVRRVKIEWVDTRYGRRIAIVFAYDQQLVEVARKLEKRWFDGERKCWLIPDDVDALDSAMGALEAVEPQIELEIDQNLKAHADGTREARRKAYAMSRAASSDFEVPTKLKPYPFQRAGVQWIDEMGGRALVGDQPGLGKTLQALGWIALRREKALPAIVLCPATLKVNWYREVLKTTDLKPLVITSKSSLKGLQKLGIEAALEPKPGYDVTILNYDLLEAQTPVAWVKAISRGDLSVVPHLLAAGQYALKAIDKAIGKAHPSIQPTLFNIRRRIEAQGAASNKKKYVKVFVNGIPLDKVIGFGFKTFVADEIHYTKDPQSQRGIAAAEISKAVPHVIGLTGTPVLNRPRELWNPVSIVNPKVFPSFFAYAKRYTDAKQNGFGWDFSGASNLEELDRILRTQVMIRRLKEQVLTELPKKIRVTIPIALNGHGKIYQEGAAEALEKLSEIKRSRDQWKAKLSVMDAETRARYLTEHAEEAASANKLVGTAISMIDKAKQAAFNAKFEECVKFILDLVEQEGKILVFASHHDAIDRMIASLEKAELKVGAIDGRVEMADRTKLVDAFQRGNLQVLVCGIRAASEGLTLTASHTVVFVELDWNPGRHEQAEDRVHRISQQSAVTIYYLVALGTLEEAIVKLIDSKREVTNAATGDGERTLNEDGILDAILEDLLR